MEFILTIIFISLISLGIFVMLLPFVYGEEFFILSPISLFCIIIGFFGIVKDDFEWNEYQITNRSMNEITGVLTVEFNGISKDFDSYKDVEYYKSVDTIKEEKSTNVN